MAELVSPCVRNCCLNEKDICLGCFRTLTEIMEWTFVSDSEKKMIIENAQERRKNLNSHLNK